jgi:hypothetical protein
MKKALPSLERGAKAQRCVRMNLDVGFGKTSTVRPIQMRLSQPIKMRLSQPIKMRLRLYFG